MVAYCFREFGEALAILRPGGLAGRIVLGRHGERLAATHFARERVVWGGGFCRARPRATEVVREMHGRRDDRDRDQGEAERTSDRGDVEEPSAHQWNICAEPGW
jgi:hypothetical protein